MAAEISESGFHPDLQQSPQSGLAMVHIFVTRGSDLTKMLRQVRPLLEHRGMTWVSWPKKSSKVPTEVKEHLIRAEAFPLGFVDIKCARWTKLVRAEARDPQRRAVRTLESPGESSIADKGVGEKIVWAR